MCDHCQNRNIEGVNLLTALYHSGGMSGMSLPVDFTLVHKTEWVKHPRTGKEHWTSKETKNEMMRRMINGFIRTQTPFRYVLADSWFSSAENMAFVKQKKGKEFVVPLKANRKVALTEEDKQKNASCRSTLTLDKETCQTIYLEQVDFPLLLIRSAVTNDGGTTSVLYLVTSDLMEVARVGLAIKHSALKGQLYQAALTRAWEQLQKLKADYPKAVIII